VFEEIKDQEKRAAHRSILEGWTERLELLITKASGASLWDDTGREFIDCTSQSFSLSVGACHPQVLEAVQEQMQKFTHLQHVMDSIPLLQLTSLLTEIAPKGLNKVNYCLEGSIAVEAAMKLAIKNKPQGRYFLALEHGYHGRTFATMAISWVPPGGPFPYYKQYVIRVPEAYCYRCAFDLIYPQCGLQCLQFTEHVINRVVDGEVIALITEPVQGNGGQISFPSEYHKGIRKICDKYDIIYISDEIQTAFGMVGEMFAADLYDTVPDILVFGKSIAGGFPLAGVLVRENLQGFDMAEHATTFSHFPLSMAAAVATLQTLKKEKLLERARNKGFYITQRLLKMKEKYEIIGDVRGPGLAIGVELVRSKKNKEPAIGESRDLIEKGLRKGVMFGISKYPGLGNVIKIKPSIKITDAQVDQVLTVFEECIKEIEKSIS